MAPATRDRVRSAADELRYEVDPQASRLATGRTMTIGLVAPLFGLWYADRVVGETPGAGVWSLPLWVYRVGMLVWALWLAAGLVRGIAWGWSTFNEGGLWRTLSLRRAPATPEEDTLAERAPLAEEGAPGAPRPDEEP